MNIAIFSDSHDNQYNMREGMRIAKERGITECFHLGDFGSPAITHIMLEENFFNWRCVWGNCDGEKAGTILKFGNNPKFSIVSDSFREEEIDGKKIFLTHFDTIAEIAGESGKYNAVFHGHTHKKYQKTLPNGTLLANPGEIIGNKTKQPSFGIWNTEKNTFEIVDITDFKLGI